MGCEGVGVWGCMSSKKNCLELFSIFFMKATKIEDTKKKQQRVRRHPGVLRGHTAPREKDEEKEKPTSLGRPSSRHGPTRSLSTVCKSLNDNMTQYSRLNQITMFGPKYIGTLT